MAAPAIGALVSSEQGNGHYTAPAMIVWSAHESSGAGRGGWQASDALLKLGRFFTGLEESDDGRVAFRKGGRAGDVFYRDWWSHDKVVRSTHGVNCTAIPVAVAEGGNPRSTSRSSATAAH